MAWLSPFKLGRPGYEISFDLNPAAMDLDEGPIDAVYRNVAGDLKRSIIKASAPTIRIQSNYLLKAQRDQFAALTAVDDTFLSFLTRDDWAVLLERNLPLTTNTVQVRNSSATKLDQALLAVPTTGHITITGVFDNPAGTGTNYYSGGSYDGASRTITLGTPLGGTTNPCYVSYTYKGWLVAMRRLPQRFAGGWVDRSTYDIELVGA